MENKTELLQKAVSTSSMLSHMKNTEKIKESLNGLINGNQQLPEYIFISDFLPMFLGNLGDDYLSRLEVWYLISNGPFGTVDLIDENNNVVAKVPPVLDRTIIKDQFNNNNNIANLFKEYENLLLISPNAAESVLSEKLHNSFTVNDINNNNLVSKWKEFLSRYTNLETKTSTNSNFSKTIDSDIEY